MASSLRAEEEFEKIYDRHVDMVYRVCFSFMKNQADTEDMVQETFLKLISGRKKFASREHEKAWLIVTASNTCKDELRRLKRKLEYISSCRRQDTVASAGGGDMSELLLALPPKYKEVVYLHYYEGYHASEIGELLHCPASTVRNKLSRARKFLKRNGV